MSISAGLPTVPTEPLPTGPDVAWQEASYNHVLEIVNVARVHLEGAKHGLAAERISCWSASVRAEDEPGQRPDSRARPCALKTDFLVEQHGGNWFWVRLRHVVAAEPDVVQYLCCLAGPSRSVAKKTDTFSERYGHLLRSVDTEAGLHQMAAISEKKMRADLNEIHDAGLAKDRTINELEIRVASLEAECKGLRANLAPVVSDEIAERTFSNVLQFLQHLAAQPSDKGLAAQVMKSVRTLMIAMTLDPETKALLVGKHRPAFATFVTEINAVARVLVKGDVLALPPPPAPEKKARTRRPRVGASV